MNKDINLKPLTDTNSIPVDWEFNNGDYLKLSSGHQLNWIVLLEDNVVHFYRLGGEEFYRFNLMILPDGTYSTKSLITYPFENFIKTSAIKGKSVEELETLRMNIICIILDEVAGLLYEYFGIKVKAGLQ